MPDDPVDKLLADEKALDARKQDAIREILRQKDAAIKAFDDKLEKLGYDHAKHRSHHRPPKAEKPPSTTTK